MTKIKMLFSSVLICLLVFFLMIVYIPKFFGYQAFYIQTGSMEPTFSKGTLVFTKKIPFENISQGDIVTFKNDTGDEFFTHRVIEVDTENQMFTTKGDANADADPSPTSYYFTVGRVDFAFPLVGYISQFLHTVIGKIVIAAVYICWAAIEIEVYVMKRKSSQED